MDFGVYLILCGGVLILGILGVLFRKGILGLLGFFLGMVTLVQAVPDNQFVTQTAYSGGFQTQTTALTPAIYLLFFFMLVDVFFVISERRHFL